jgi:hypothetical protein
MELPNLYVMVLDVTTSVFKRSLVGWRYEIVAFENLAA